DVALHRQGVTFALDRAGITGDDGASHNGMWDLSILQVVPNPGIAVPRDPVPLRELRRESVAVDDGPTVVRAPTGAVRPARCAAPPPTPRTCCWSRWGPWPRPAARSPTGWPTRASASPSWTRAGSSPWTRRW